MMKKALKQALKKPKEKQVVYNGNKVTPRHPRPGAQAVSQAPLDVTPYPHRYKRSREADRAGQWDPLAGSRHGRSNLRPTCKKRTSLRDHEDAWNLGIKLSDDVELSDEEEEKDHEKKEEAADEGYLSADEIKGILDSRFESSRVKMLDKDTLVLIGPDGTKEYFVKQLQTGRGPRHLQVSKMATLEGALSPHLSSPLLCLLTDFPRRYVDAGSRRIRRCGHSAILCTIWDTLYYLSINTKPPRLHAGNIAFMLLISACILLIFGSRSIRQGLPADQQTGILSAINRQTTGNQRGTLSAIHPRKFHR